MSTLETLLPLCIKLMETLAAEPSTILRVLTQHPAEILGVKSGTLSVGAAADIAVIDPEVEWSFDTSDMRSQGKNTAFNNWPFKGKIRHTLIGGEMRYSCQ